MLHRALKVVMDDATPAKLKKLYNQLLQEGALGYIDFVLQSLRRFPGKGWPLIRTGIRSPVIRNRHMALKVLSR